MRAALVIALSAVALVQAEQVQTPQRDSTAPASQSRPGRIRGRVLAADTGRPLGRAQVTISAPSWTQRTLTDEDGRYEFTGLSVGSFGITAIKTGYLALQYGQRRPFEPGRPVAVASGQTIDRIDLSLPRGAVIAARLTDDLGFPLAGVEVSAQRYEYRANGERSLVQTSGGIPAPSVTDDRGEIRLFGLMPGEYIVAAVPRFIGSSNVNRSEEDGYATTFYPGVVNPSQATPVVLRVGEEVPAHFSIVRTRLARVSGFVADAQGKPANGAVVSFAATSGLSPSGLLRLVGPDGRFEIDNVPPGDYGVMLTFDTIQELRPAITVAGVDITGLQFAIGAGSSISGRVVPDGTAPAGRLPASLRVVIGSIRPYSGPGLAPEQRSTALDADGRFGITGLSGRVAVGMTLPAGWMMKSVIADGRDITHAALDLSGRATVPNVVVTITNKLTAVTGQVSGTPGQPLADYVVIIVPVERHEAAIMARLVRVVRPDPDGTFTARAVMPGRYAVVAIEALEQGRHFSPAFQQEVRRLGQELTLGEGETSRLNLRLTPDL